MNSEVKKESENQKQLPSVEYYINIFKDSKVPRIKTLALDKARKIAKTLRERYLIWKSVLFGTPEKRETWQELVDQAMIDTTEECKWLLNKLPKDNKEEKGNIKQIIEDKG